MRLICPNCDAQYEVEASLIPTSGRDVQCSNCGKTWFQEPRDTLKLTTEQEVPEPVAAAPEPAFAEQSDPVGHKRDGLSGDGLGREAEDFFGSGPPVSDDPGFGDTDVALAPDTGAAHSDDPDFDMDRDLIDESKPFESEGPEEIFEDAAAEEFEEEGEVVEAHRPEIDAAVMGILKSEADREMAARRADAEQVETQTELGVDDPGSGETVADRTARLRGADDEPGDFREQEPRRSLLPDIDEINSTLTATSDRSAAADAAVAAKSIVAEATAKRRVGFRLGFSMMLIIAAALILLYLFAPQIARTMPSAEPQLASYVDWANGMRQLIDTYLKDSVNRLTTLLVELTT